MRRGGNWRQQFRVRGWSFLMIHKHSISASIRQVKRTFVQSKKTFFSKGLLQDIHRAFLKHHIENYAARTQHLTYIHALWSSRKNKFQRDIQRHLLGAIWARVFIVSNGCPTRTWAAPPTLPARSSFIVARVFCFMLERLQSFSTMEVQSMQKVGWCSQTLTRCRLSHM